MYRQEQKRSGNTFRYTEVLKTCESKIWKVRITPCVLCHDTDNDKDVLISPLIVLHCEKEMVIASSTPLHFFWDQSTVLTFNLLIQLFPLALLLCVMLCTLCDETFVLMFMKVLTQINSSDLSPYTSNKENISFQSDSMTSWALHLKKKDHISGISTKVGLQICRIGN